jgi:signal transduction histidine kinase
MVAIAFRAAVDVLLRDLSNALTSAVRDSGPGLDAQHRARISEAFYTTKTEGMGMGLAISRSIVDARGGRLWATANDGPGETFQFTLPSVRKREGHVGVS